MSKPIPGKPYTVVKGDTLSGIARKAYGKGKEWRRIWEANQTVLKSGDPNLIYPGEIITIPVQQELERKKNALRAGSLPTLANKDPDSFAVVVDNIEIPTISARAIRSIETVADGWTATVVWTPGVSPYTEILKPYRYAKAAVYLGGELMIDGFLYTVENIVDDNGTRKNLEGYSATADIVDSTLKPPYERSLVTLFTRVQELVTPLGIPVKSDLATDVLFLRVTAEQNETIFSHLSKLAAQHSALITSTELGEILITQAAKGKPVGTLTEGLPPFTVASIKWDGRMRYNAYKANAQGPNKSVVTATAKDTVVPRSRFLTFSADEAQKTDIQFVANWKRSKQIAESLSMTLPVSSWYAPDGSRWKENTLVTVVSPSLHLDAGFTFLIKAVEFIYQSNGVSAVLSLVPPQVYTGLPVVEPWLSVI
jgi:prophage tail gpP-like protein